MLDRNRNIFKQIKWSFVFKALAFIAYYAAISLQVKILGSELYGVWATLLSIVTWVVFFDFGLGNGIKNYLTKAISLNNLKEARQIILTGYVAISIISIFLFIVVVILANIFDLSALFNTNALSDSQLTNIVIVLFGFIFMHFVVSFVKQFVFAIQKNSLNEMEQLLFYLLLLISLMLLTWKSIDSVLGVVIAYGTSILISKLCLTALFFSKNKELIPSPRNFQKNIMGKLMNVGMAFFALQLVSMFILLSDRIIITQLLGPASVTSYDIVYRLFSVVLILHGIVNAPMWSAYTEAYTKQDKNWIVKNLKKMKLLVFSLVSVTLVLYLFSSELIKLWVGDEVTTTDRLSLYMAVYVIVLAWCNNYAFFLNAINNIKIQFYMLLVGAVINIPLSVYFVKYQGLGSSGVVLATIISLSLFAIAGPIQTQLILKKCKYNVI
ncbi:lipopolysaccharide biosynthesis protein [Vibrio splendidus]